MLLAVKPLWLRKLPSTQDGAKRLLDIILSAALLLIFYPVLMAICLAIRLESAGPAIFRQCRVGKHEQLFTCLKFRTMYDKSDDNIHRLAVRSWWYGERLSDDPEAPYKLADDPRVTLLGCWLRRKSLDELPQLINVLRGEMSIVGPRPAIPYELDYYQDWHHARHQVKPGITGLWQVSGRGSVSLAAMLELDVKYAESWCLTTDIMIILRTIPALFGHGAR